MAKIGTFEWWPNLYRLSLDIGGSLDDQETHKNLMTALGVLEQSGRLRHLHLENHKIPNQISMSLALSCKKLQSWGGLRYQTGFEELRRVIEAQKESLEILELSVGPSNNNQVFSVLSECPKLKKLKLDIELKASMFGQPFSIVDLGFCSNLTTLELRLSGTFQNQDFPAPDSLPKLKTVKISTGVDNFSFVVSLLDACQNLQSFNIMTDKAITTYQINHFVRKCPNIEVLKIRTRDQPSECIYKKFPNLHLYCPKIRFLQWKNGTIEDWEDLMRISPSLIAIESLHGLSVDSRMIFENIDDVINTFIEDPDFFERGVVDFSEIYFV